MKLDPPVKSDPSSALVSEYIAIATIGIAVGFDGWCRIFAFGKTLENLKLPCRLKVGIDNPVKTVVIEELKKHFKAFKGLFEGYSTRESISELKNFYIYIEKESLPENQANEFYHFELEGMKIFSSNSKEQIGTVTEVYNYPTVDAIEIKKKDGKLFIIPMSEDFIETVDTNLKSIYINDSAIDELL